MRSILKEMKIVSAWKTGNRKKKASKKMKRNSRSASVLADAIAGNGNVIQDVL
jgi:hypothetical protein